MLNQPMMEKLLAMRIGHRTDHPSGGSLRSSARSAHGPRLLRAPTHSTAGLPTANASRFPARSDCAHEQTSGGATLSYQRIGGSSAHMSLTVQTRPPSEVGTASGQQPATGC